MKNILVVEDEPFIRDELVFLLENAGYKTDKIVDFRETSQQILAYKPDLLILDLNLPEESGFQICKTIKSKSSIPILFLTSREHLKDELLAFKLGGDEYLTKPFRKERLLARVENLLKIYEGKKGLIRRGNLLLDTKTHTLYAGDKAVLLSQNHGILLEVLFSCDNRVATKQELSMKLWNTTDFIDENALQVNITRLKKVLKDENIPLNIKAVRGFGYILEGEDNEK